MPAGAKTRPTHAAPTLELRVRNMSFLLERLGRDCAPDQFVRELTVNAIQAVQRAGGNGVVAWDHDPVYSRRFGAAKLCIVDTGVGMTGPEMVEYINHLASSAGTQRSPRRRATRRGSCTSRGSGAKARWSGSGATRRRASTG